MDSPEGRITELELRYDHQTDRVEQLDGRVLELHKELIAAEARITRLEQTLEQVLQQLLVPPNEKPPHY